MAATMLESQLDATAFVNGEGLAARDPSMPPPGPGVTAQAAGEASGSSFAAYYSLAFPNFTYYLQTLDVTIGRRLAPAKSEFSRVDAAFNCISGGAYHGAPETSLRSIAPGVVGATVDGRVLGATGSGSGGGSSTLCLRSWSSVSIRSGGGAVTAVGEGIE